MKLVRTEVAFHSPWMDLLAKTFDESNDPYYTVKVPDYTSVIALTTDRRVVLVRQYRPAVEHHTIELPSGVIDPGESPEETARRELLEETGYQASQWHVLLDYFSSPGYTTERIRIFLARGVKQAAHNGYVREQEEKYIVADWVPLAEAVRLALAGKLHNGPAIAGVLAGYAASSEEFSGLSPATATGM